MASLSASCNEFVSREAGEQPFQSLIKELFESLQTAKTCRLSLCGDDPPAPVFSDFLDRFDPEMGVCNLDGRSPATQPLVGGDGGFACALSNDQIDIGGQLTRRSRVLISTESLGSSLRVPVFGYHVRFTGDEEQSGRFGRVAASGALRRAWDFGLPEAADAPLLFLNLIREPPAFFSKALPPVNPFFAQSAFQTVPDRVEAGGRGEL